jgi:hypothetical protein
MHPSTSQEMVLMDWMSEGTAFIFFFFLGDAVQCHSTLCCFVSGSNHPLLFCFWIKVMELAFLTCYAAMKKVGAFNSTLFQQLQWNKLSDIPDFLPSHEAEHSIVCVYPVKCCFSLMSSSIFLSFLLEYSQLLAKHNGAVQQRLCSYPKMFYLPSDTATAHAVSSYTCWNRV